MKKFAVIIITLLSAISCTNLDEVWAELRDHEERIQKLEALCNKLNSNVEAIQTILTAMEQNDYVTDIVKVMEDGVEVGYSITFAKGGTVTIYHGTNGADGAAPQISIKKAQDGEYYWTADGEWMTDENGEKIPASVPNDPDGKYITPYFRIAEGVWYISFDGGNTWKVIETEEGQKCPIFEAVEIGEDHYTFYLNDGTVLTVPAYNPFAEISQYAGKIVSLIGDSISTFKGSIPEGNSYYYPKFDVKSPEDTWWSMLIDYMDAQLGINNSWAGSRVTNRSESNTGNIGPDRCMPSIARIESLDDKGTPDIILFYGGTNDVYDTVPLGSFDKNSLHTTVDLERTIWDNFADAYKDAIMRLQHYYPYAQIVCISPTYSNITTDYIKNLDSYISVIKDISDYFGAHFIDLRKCGITLESSKTEYGFFGDVTHPRKEGMKLIAKYIYRQICTMIQYDEENIGKENSEVDLFVFAGQSNMTGAAYLGPTEEVITESAYEYKYAPILRGEERGKFVHAQHPAGEWHYMDPAKAYGPAYLDEATGKSKLANFLDHTYFAPASRNLEKTILSQSEYDHKVGPSMPPYFAKYYTEMGNGCIYAHMAKGACQIIHYFTPDAVTEYNRLIADYNAANSTSYSGLSSSSLTGGGNAFDAKYFAMLRDYAEFRPGVTIKNKCFVWLQGESDEHNYIQYKLKLQALWSHLQSVGFTHFFILRVGYWGSYSIINEIKAQEDFCAENENCYIITRAPSLIPYPGATTSNWWKYEPSYEYNDCRDSYITNTTNKHFNEKAFKIFARKSADNIHRILHLGLEPLLEEENIKDMLPDDDNNEEPVEGEELTPVIISGAYISSQQIYTVDDASCVHVFKVVPGTRYYLSAEKGPTGVDSNRNLIYAPIKDIKDVVPGSAVQFASGYTERIVIYAKDDVNGASDVFTVPSDCNYIAVSSYKSGAIINVIGQRADYYYGGVELYTVVEEAYLGNVVPTKFTASSTAYSQIFAVEPNTTYKATAVNPDKQIVYVLLESDTGLTIGGPLDFVSSNTTGARTVGEKNEPQVITTTADCHFIAFSGFKGTDGKYQHVKLEKLPMLAT